MAAPFPGISGGIDNWLWFVLSPVSHGEFAASLERASVCRTALDSNLVDFAREAHEC
jgi:hypothetical protein